MLDQDLAFFDFSAFYYRMESRFSFSSCFPGPRLEEKVKLIMRANAIDKT